MPQKFTENFYGPEGTQRALTAPAGCPEGGTTHQGALGGPGAPWWVVPTSGAPGPPLCSINNQIFQKP